MPDCPKCRTALTRKRNDIGIFWHCQECSGSAVTISLMRKMVPAKAMNGLWQRARLGSHPLKHDCPACSRKMEEISVEAEGRTRAIDVCTTCQFIWLDDGEWQDLIFFQVDNTNAESIRSAVRERISQKRRERSPSQRIEAAPPLPTKRDRPRPPEIRPKPAEQTRQRAAVKPPPIAGHAAKKARNEPRDKDLAQQRERERSLASRQKRRSYDSTPRRESGWGRGPRSTWQWIPALLGMPMEDDQPVGPRQQGEKPMFTWFLSLGIVMVSLLAFLDLQTVVDNYGLIPAEYGRKGGFTWVSAFFLHADLLHLIGNAYFLVIFGDNVEKCLGTIEFFLLLCLATASGHFFHILLEPNSTIPCIGASGGISGVIAFYALRFRHHQLTVMIWVIIKTYWLQMSAIWLFCIWVIMQLFIANQQISGLSNVSGGAHLGGALAGAFVWLIWRMNNISQFRSESGWATK